MQVHNLPKHPHVTNKIIFGFTTLMTKLQSIHPVRA